MGKSEKDLFVEMMKKTSQDPKAMAECVRQFLLQDEIIKAPKNKGIDEDTVIGCTKDILRSL
jgi:hypothetical protein